MLFSAGSIADTHNLITSFDGFKWGTPIKQITTKFGGFQPDSTVKSFSIHYTVNQGVIGGFKVAKTTFGFDLGCVVTYPNCYLEYGIYTLKSKDDATFTQVSSILLSKYGKPTENHRTEQPDYRVDKEVEVVELVFLQSDGSSVTLAKSISESSFHTTTLDFYQKGVNNIQIIYNSPELNEKNKLNAEVSRDF